MHTVIDAITKAIQETGKARFVSLEYTNAQGEIARHTIKVNVRHKATLRRNKIALQRQETQGEIEAQAKSEIMASLNDSLVNGIGKNQSYTCKDVYRNLGNGFKIHEEKGEVYLSGYGIAKKVLREGTPKKPVKSKPLTIAKRSLEKACKFPKFRQFKLSQLSSIKTSGKEIIIIAK